MTLVSIGGVAERIRTVRGHRVLLDADLAALYGVETKALKRAVKRNKARFPTDFMFVLSRDESASLRRQIGTSNRGGSRYAPFAFTEQGVAMLSGVLNSERAIRVNIAIMRAFVKLRTIVSTRKEMARRLNELERRVKSHDHKIDAVFEAIRQLMEPPEESRRSIGFRP